MKYVPAIVIGAGQAGLAVSRCLTDRGIEHTVIERGRIAQRWSERWDSLRLLTPNWMTRLPGWSYDGNDRDGFMSRDQVITFLRDYARSFDAPVEEETEVFLVSPWADGWRVITDRGTWIADHVVVATGHCQTTRVPACAAALSPDLVQLASSDYRSPRQLPEGNVLVAGAASSGVQIARELRRSGREVVLSVGRHFRLPRRYRGRDIHFWLDRMGVMTRPLSDVRDPLAARRETSLQLTAGESIDLRLLAGEGVRLAGRLRGLDGTRAHFGDDLGASAAEADRQMRHILLRIDRHIAGHGAERVFPREPWPADFVPAESPAVLDLAAEGIRSVVWATGYRRDYSWLEADVFDAGGEIRHWRGRTAARGLHVIGLQFLTRRNSSLIDGVGRDAQEIAGWIARDCRARKEAA